MEKYGNWTKTAEWLHRLASGRPHLCVQLERSTQLKITDFLDQHLYAISISFSVSKHLQQAFGSILFMHSQPLNDMLFCFSSNSKPL